MPSTTKETNEAFDLERDLPLTDEDLAALRRAKDIRPLDFETYLRWLSDITTAGRDRHDLPSLDVPFKR